MTFRPPWALRLWYGVLGLICLFTVGGAPAVPFLWGYALLVSVRIDDDRVEALVMGWFGRPKFTGPPPAG